MSSVARSARRLADCVALAFDPQAQGACRPWWFWTRPDHAKILELLRAEPLLAQPLAELADTPHSLAAYEGLARALAELLPERPETAQKLADVLDTIEQSARLGLHVGAGLAAAPAADPLTAQQILAGLDSDGPRPGDAPALVTVVIPFRAKDPADGRIRNLAACLAGLADQELPRDRYRVVVVESDSEPRWKSVLEPYVDRYLFAENPGPFNKAWAVNCGVVHSGGPDALVCILDGDVLPDADLLARGAGRFDQDPTLQVHWPYRDIIFADPESSDRAVALRCTKQLPAVDHALLHGTFLRRPPGGCIWIRRRLFDRMAGLDERFEGWGGEDNDFAWRAEFAGGIERFGDTLIHLHHASAHPDATNPPPARSRDHHWCSWPPGSKIGDLARYRVEG